MKKGRAVAALLLVVAACAAPGRDGTASSPKAPAGPPTPPGVAAPVEPPAPDGPAPVEAALPAPPPEPIQQVAPTARVLFVADGGVGVEILPHRPDFESEFIVIVLELDNVGRGIFDFQPQDIVIKNAKGKVSAHLHRLHPSTRLDARVPAPALDASGSVAFYLDSPGTPFDGHLPYGRTRLRVRASLWEAPGYGDVFELTFRSPTGILRASGKIEVRWPT